MNRPSRTDDISDHPTWNQNPPSLAADLTTCEDMNGIANTREYRNGNGNAMDGKSGLGMMENPLLMHTMIPPGDSHPGPHSLGPRSDYGSHSKETVAFVTGSLPLTTASSPHGRRSKAVLSWAAWILSVAATSVLLNKLSIPNLFSSSSPARFSPGPLNATLDQACAPVHSSPSTFAGPATVLTVSKRATCGTGSSISEEEYDTPFHVGALIIILALSTGACAAPLIMKRVPSIRMPPHFFFSVRHFGTGVLLATAFVHLLPTAFIFLGDPCLSSFWTEDYPAMPGAIALAGVFFVTLIEMIFSPHRHIHRDAGKATVSQPDAVNMDSGPVADLDIEKEPPLAATTSGPARDMGPLRGSRLSISRQLSVVGGRPDAADLTHQPSVAKSEVDTGTASFEKVKLTRQQQHNKDILQCMLLEMGILFHSVFIGMAISVSVGNEFIILLIAISFHQSFEGLALGARIAAIDWPENTWQPWLMALAYGCTTPIGQAIGLGIHSLYDPEGEVGLVLVGTMNAISSGLLVFASLVELLSEDFLSDESWKVLRGNRRVMACLLVLAGALGMSLVGAWA